MNKKMLRIILALVVIIILAVVVSFFLFRSAINKNIADVSPDASGSLPNSGTIPITGSGVQEPTIGGVPVSDPNFATSVLVEDLKKRSVIIIERLGSYSSDRPLSNFNDILPQTTATMEVVLRDAREEKENRFREAGTYEGYSVIAVTTNAPTVDIVNGRIVIAIDAIREITLGALPTDRQNTAYSLTWDIGEDAIWRLSGITGNF